MCKGTEPKLLDVPPLAPLPGGTDIPTRENLELAEHVPGPELELHLLVEPVLLVDLVVLVVPPVQVHRVGERELERRGDLFGFTDAHPRGIA